MTARNERRSWVTGLLAVALALGPAGAAWAEEPLAAGTKDLGLGGAISISHDTRQDLETATAFQFLPHVGYVASDAMGPGWLRGNVELLLEPTLLRLETHTASATVVGVSALVRWIFTGTRRLRPYLEAGAGVLAGEINLRQTNCEVNFLFQGGPGLLVLLPDRTAVTIAYRLQHISNAGACEFNVGINSSALYLGVSYLFP